MARKILIIIVIILIVALVILAVIFSSPLKEGEEEIGKAKEEEEGPVITEEIYGLSGEIKEIKDKTLLVEANILLANPMKKPLKQTVEIVVTDETKILKLKFPEEIPEGSTEPIFPEETEIIFDDLKVGDKIDIETAENVSENIKNKTEITASVINVVE